MRTLNLDLVVPVYNEEEVLEKNILLLHSFLKKNLTLNWQITIADNASTDATLKIAKDLTKRYNEINCIHLDEKGKGRALKAAWTQSQAEIMGYLDVDLAYDLNDLPLMVQSLQQNASIATGNRYDSRSVVDRGWKRTILSQAYRAFVRLLLETNLNDFQGGFKFINKQVKQKVLPLVKDTGWFFDTELLVLAEKCQYSIVQLPIKCYQGKNTKLNIVKDARFFSKNLFNFRRRLKSEGLL